MSTKLASTKTMDRRQTERRVPSAMGTYRLLAEKRPARRVEQSSTSTASTMQRRSDPFRAELRSEHERGTAHACETRPRPLDGDRAAGRCERKQPLEQEASTTASASQVTRSSTLSIKEGTEPGACLWRDCAARGCARSHSVAT